jgi:hypothetical protein
MNCDIRGCEREAIMAIASRTPQNKQGLVSTIYQFVEDAPKVATRTCGPCGIDLAANLAALTDSDLQVNLTVAHAEGAGDE